ncbi:baseplate J/gp47 family protein [Sedimentitalea nanhaiensis]|uniref:Baseplate assembly protein n=1 Tax=Sedimentitalea nanhaiensis TaxID=999627 RepID=A0A1I7BHR5_9RHOB|nr:hypothetical protein [Sedimentitalea nanhaiensis]SFT86661.1 hypothetical protein SAMN05216236_11062 [Sedimentitalea nanhaiensis]
MTFTHPNRPDMKPDLTRWNRAGLSRFDYVDGDAAVWLEELRIAMLGLYLRGAPDEERTPEHWRDIYLRPEAEWPDAADAAARVAWKRLAPVFPPQQETRGRRSERLLKQYNNKTDDYSWELNRAFARASHVLLGYLNAYANEGYLRTATQWDNLRRLAAMVNYQPTPPASATASLALILKQDAGAVEIARGLAMKHTPAEGGSPLIFETLDKVDAHPALNAARAVDWNRNPNDIPFGKTGDPDPVRWHLPGDQTLAPGDLAVLANGSTGEAHSIDTIAHDTDAEQADIAFASPPAAHFPYWSSRLHTAADDVRTGLRQTKSGGSVVSIKGGGGFVMGDIIEMIVDGTAIPVEILAVVGTDLILNTDLSGETTVTLRPMLAFALDDGGKALASQEITTMHFLGQSGPFPITVDPDTSGDNLSNIFAPSGAKTRRGHASDTSAKTISGRVKHRKPPVLPGKPPAPTKTVSFEGKPPKGLAENDWFVARDLKSDALSALQVRGVRVSSGEYHVLFDKAPAGNHEDTEFHGPLKTPLAAVGYDRNPRSVMAGATARLSDIPETARQLLKPGRRVIVSRMLDGTPQDVLATLTAITPKGGQTVEIALDPIDTAAGWANGDTVFHLNTAIVSHGETKGTKILGSGDGERAAQVFDLAVKDISHIPSTTAESGVIPDIDIAVDGQRWDYRDYIDPAAEGTRAWSTTLTDDGKLKIHFRRRLVTGQNNIVVTRHRVGTGLAGTGIPAFSLSKPMKKHRHVDAVHQPFPTSGGADREPVAKLRQSAPSRMMANGRAVSLGDFERLAVRNAAILRAHAEEISTPTAMRKVELTLVPTGGATLTKSLQDDLRPAILNKCIPGVSVSFREYETLPLHLGVTVRADLTVNDKTDIKAAAEAILSSAFSLEARDFGQTAYVSEVLAALETVPGIENAIATRFDLGDGYDLFQPRPPGFTGPWPRNVATRDNAVAAIYATAHQVIHIPTGSAGSIAVIVEDI